MEIAEHKKEFDRITEKYCLKDPEKAEEIANFLLKQKKISAEEFAKYFAMSEKDAKIFLSFIEKGISFKENVLDKK